MSSGYQRPPVTDPAAIMALIEGNDPFGPADACWTWTGPVGAGGYAMLPLAADPAKSSGTMAGRAVYRLARPRDPLPGDVQLRRRCGNKLCVRPDHGERLTRAERLAAEEAAGQRPSLDEIRPKPKLDRTQVRWIRENGMDSSKWQGMAKLMGISVSNVRAIMQRKTWKDVAPDIPAWTSPEVARDSNME